ncbi:hypothetical protein [Rhabdothermincola salaria]|uniref:hypothetical protein n=1 Tax=Rhabdothermincola salaria TaxID=2903142 RepID=UPI001E2CD039|nr:hypothetical protein [Rhabdothermincola salaria]MCD9624944.1 hypothetical protein [Rhabdothermincola salaria]
MKLITVPVKVLVRLVVLPVKLVLATVGFTFKTGYKAGALPVKGSVVAGRALGLKALVVLALGVAGGIAIGRRLGPSTPSGDDASGSAWSPSRDRSDQVGSVSVDETVVVAETADGTMVIDDVVVTEETADGTVVTETVTVDEVEAGDTELDPETAALDAEVSHVLGETAGDDASDTSGDA